MNAQLRQIFSMGLLAILLVSTIGIPVSRHICNLSGHADIALFTTNYKGCCEAEPHCADDAGTVDDCCDQEEEYFKLDIPKKHEEPQKLVALIPIELPYLMSWAIQGEEPENYTLTLLTDLSPPLSGQDVLKGNQVFRL